MSRRNHSQLNNASRLSQSSANTKLRTIMKNRNGHNIDSQSSFASNSKLDKYAYRLPTLPTPSYQNYQTISNDSNLLQRQIEARRSQTLNCEEDLIMNKDMKPEDIPGKLKELDQKAQSLIHKKLLKISKKSRSFSLKDKGKDELSDQLQQLIKSVKRIKIEAMEEKSLDQEKVQRLMDEKLHILEKLMAEKSAQSAILKKYFFAISALNQRKKFSLEKCVMKTLASPSRIEQNATSSPKKQVCKESAHYISYKAPKLDEYETYRYKGKEYSANLQPLPRSSYNREFLNCGSQPKGTLYRNIDNNPFFGLQSKQKKSNYSNDFKTMRADKINYKQLDSYRNKIKDIQISYTYNKNELSPEEVALNKKYIRDQMKDTIVPKALSSKRASKIKIPENVKNPILSTESRSAYAGTRGNSSDIKHKGLDRLKYAYKSMVYC